MIDGLSRVRRLWLVLAWVSCFGATDLLAQAHGEQLTVKRIYSQPSLSGRPYRGVAWSPDSKLVSFLETKGQGKDAKPELWVMDAASGERRVLVSAEKLETVLPPDKPQSGQATG